MLNRNSVSAIALLATLNVAGLPAFAATAAETGGAQLEEIVVTAEKHSENLQKAPVAVTALSADDLQKEDIKTALDLGKDVPGLIIGNTGPNPQMFMRGVGGGASSSFRDPAFAFNVDGVNYSRPTGATGAFFDVAQVEVLKGPQGTLYGRNTAAGAFNVTTNDPVFKYQGEVGAGFGNYNDFTSEGMINVPLTDQLAVRAAVKTERHDGYLSLGYNDADDIAGRVKVLYQANDDLSIKLTTSYFNKGGKGPGDVPLSRATGTYANPSNPWQEFLSAGVYPNFDTAVPADGYQKTSVYLAQLDLQWDLGFADLFVTPAYVQDDHSGLGYDAGFYQRPNQHSDQYSIEGRLASKPASPVKWQVGIYDLKEDESLVLLQQIGANRLPPSFPTPNYLFETVSDPDIGARSTAGYGQATYPILDWLRITAGARYTQDRKFQSATTTDGFRTAAATFNDLVPGVPVVSGGDKTWHYFNWKVGVDADITPTSLVYANAATGTKPGGFDTNNYVGPYSAEKLTAWSLGTKNRFFENRLQVNAEAFYYYYKNLQVSQFAFGNPPGFGPTPSNSIIAFVTLNAPASHIAGIEASIDYLLTDDDRFTINGQYLHARFDNYFVPAFAPVGQVATNYAGLTKDHSPTWSGNLSYDHTFELANQATIVAGIHTLFSTSVWESNQRTPIGDLQPAYTLTDAQITYTPSSASWSISAHVNNVENNAVLTDALASPAAGRSTSYWATPYPPRTYGVSFKANF